MDAVLKWIGIVGAAWMLLSILAGIAWALGGKRIFRKPPQPPVITIAPRTEAEKDFVAKIRRQIRQNGRGI